jgi:hypothetical protein
MNDFHERQSALALRLCAPVLQCAWKPEGLRAMPVETRPAGSSGRAAFSGLEALGRLLCGIAPWLEFNTKCPQETGDGSPDLAAVHRLIEISCAQSGPAALNFTQGLQPLVDAAFLAQAVLRAPTALWESLPAAAQEYLVQALKSTRTIKPHFNNWLLFPAMIEAAFCKLGLPWDRMRVDYALRQHEQWYCGDGLYSDGPHFHFDYYNSYVIQPMLTDILDAVAGKDPDWDAMASRQRGRMSRTAQILERLIGPDGSFPPIGRSITYRGAAFQPLAQLALKEQLPESLPPAQVRSALDAVAQRTLGADENFDEDGWLRIGLSGHQPNLAERYVSTGSLYLCGTIFLPLGLPCTSSYWKDDPLPWTQQRLWTGRENLTPDLSIDG